MSPKKVNTHFARTKKELAKETGKKKKKVKKAKLGIKVIKSKPVQKPEIFEEKLEKTAREYGLNEEEIQDINENIDKSKRLIIVFGVSFFVILIAIFWVINAKHSLIKVNSDNDNGIYETWEKISENMQKQFQAIQTGTEAIANLKEKLIETASSSPVSTAITTSTIDVLGASGSIELLMDRINEENKQDF